MYIGQTLCPELPGNKKAWYSRSCRRREFAMAVNVLPRKRGNSPSVPGLEARDP